MPLESLTGTKFIDALVSSNPAGGDDIPEGDDHIRGLKNVLLKSFPGITGAVTATQTELNYNDITTLGTAEASKVLTADATGVTTGAKLASAVLTTPQIDDASSTHQFVVDAAELTADRTVTLPALSSADTFVFASHAQTLANKTIGTGTVIALGSDAAGDIYYFNGTNFVRLGIGLAGQSLKVNSLATAPEWSSATSATLEVIGEGTGAGNWGAGNDSSGTIAHGLSATPDIFSFYLECVNAEGVWATGDRIGVSSYRQLSSGTLNYSFSVNADATNVFAHHYGFNVSLIEAFADGGGTGTVSKANFKLMCKAQVL